MSKNGGTEEKESVRLPGKQGWHSRICGAGYEKNDIKITIPINNPAIHLQNPSVSI